MLHLLVYIFRYAIDDLIICIYTCSSNLVCNKFFKSTRFRLSPYFQHSSPRCWIKWPWWILWCYILHWFCSLHSIGIERSFWHQLQCSKIFNIMPQKLIEFNECDVISLIMLIWNSIVQCCMSPSFTYLTPLLTIMWQWFQSSYHGVSCHHQTFILKMSLNPTCDTPKLLSLFLTFH